MLGKKPVLIDLDGLICNTNLGVIQGIYTRFGLAEGMGHDDIWHYEFVECIPGLRNDQLYSIFHEKLFWEGLLPYDGAQEFLEELHSMFEIHIVTDRRWYTDLAQETERWLQGYNLFYDFLAVWKGREKYIYAREKGCVAAVEDSPKNALLLRDVCPTILIERPWNLEYSNSKGLLHAESYTGIINLLQHYL